MTPEEITWEMRKIKHFLTGYTSEINHVNPTTEHWTPPSFGRIAQKVETLNRAYQAAKTRNGKQLNAYLDLLAAQKVLGQYDRR